MNEWIDCNLPWSIRLDWGAMEPYPNMEDKIVAHFGKNKAHWTEDFFPGYGSDGMDFLTDHPIFREYEEVQDQLIDEHLEDHYTDDQLKELLTQSDNQAVLTVLAFRAKMKEIEEWVDQQPEWLAACQANEAIRLAHKEREAKCSFSGGNLNRAGTVIEFMEDGKLQEMMIGTINELGGSCDDCRGISDDTIILRYKVLWNGQSSQDTSQ